jgi:hypothetical protein
MIACLLTYSLLPTVLGPNRPGHQGPEDRAADSEPTFRRLSGPVEGRVDRPVDFARRRPRRLVFVLSPPVIATQNLFADVPTGRDALVVPTHSQEVEEKLLLHALQQSRTMV